MPLELWLTLAAVFLSVGLVSGAVTAMAISYAAPGRRRLRTIGDGASGSLVKENVSLVPSVGPTLQRFAKFVPKSPKEMSRIQKRMAMAGHYGLGPALVFSASEFITPFVLGGACFVLVHGPTKVLVTILAAMLGYVTPGVVLRRLINNRKKIIQNGLPDALDLFIVCLEAGSSIDQAILKTSQDLDVPYPPLAEELRMITTEMRAGKPRLDAFRNFATRCGVDDVKALVNMLVQADRFGTSIAQALRTHAETSRTKRRQRAEERAAKIGVKMIFPLVFCLFPAFSVVTVGPGVVQLIRFFSQQLVK
jgi:tight adherence protein C